MDLGAFLIGVPIFFLFYQGVGLLLDARSQNRSWTSVGEVPQEAASKKILREFAHFSGKLGFNKVLLRHKQLNDRLELLLLRSGYPYGWKAEDLLLCKELCALFFVLLIWRMGTGQPVAYPGAALIGFWLPDLYIQSKVTARQAFIQKQLPGFVDLMALAMESGLDFMAAVERIMEKMKPGSLREELATLLQENRLGTPRKEALQHLAFRVNLPDIQSLTSIIIQSEELGTGLATVLRSYAEDMRSRRILRAEEMAGKAPVKLLFPMMVFFFPIVFVIIFGPLALNFMSGYK
ncbi:MAG: hypothetical protein A2992_01085 [Elusimicrobia bacterium RIFCSPLOWO2_01_FULL_59_12]|nr:MAG: hypothetical protein A2992_01085 [Elusimicrobia bacterium RIFCSPLOWO2_01_FULL_59_12]